MRYVKIEMVVKPELVASIMDLVKADVVSLSMVIADGEQAKPLRTRTRVSSAHRRDGGLPGSLVCALEIMKSGGPDKGWTYATLGDAMHAAKGYAASSGSSTLSGLVKRGYATRWENGLVYPTVEGLSWRAQQ